MQKCIWKEENFSELLKSISSKSDPEESVGGHHCHWLDTTASSILLLDLQLLFTISDFHDSVTNSNHLELHEFVK